MTPVERNRSQLLRPGETLDALFDGDLQLIQGERGCRFSIDAPLLAAAVRAEPSARVVDLGCGNGVVAIAVAHLWRPSRVVGVELQAQLADRATRNARLNALDDIVEVSLGDVRQIKEVLSPQAFDVAVMNPPYYPSTDGRTNPDTEKAVARHEIHGTLADFISAAAYALDRKGRLVCIYPAFRLPMLMESLSEKGLKPTWLRPIHPRPGEDATLFLIEARKGGAPQFSIRAPLVIHENEAYSAEVKAVLEGRVGDQLDCCCK